ncbi:MAG: hypothetical protein OEY59_03860 [Deltaproteobacteria bacterium]|nr:hypothetical protein [Deltaproteobacteria bacterium]
MAEASTSGQAQPENASEEQEKQTAPVSTDPEVIKKIESAITIPDPDRDKFWEMESPILKSKKSSSGLFGIFKKKGITDEEIAELRKVAIQQPGNTRTKVQSLKKDYPNNPNLLMLSAICTHGMVMNSSNQDHILAGLKNATKEAAMCLLSDGISVYNCDNFFKIYYIMLDRFKRYQIKQYDITRHDPRLESYKGRITNSMRVCDFLSQDKAKTINITAHLKKKLKTSHYTTSLSIMDLRKACSHIEQGTLKENVGIGTASEFIAYIYALSIAFARIPILNGLVDLILDAIPSNNRALYLRKVSIQSVRLFSRFKVAAQEGEQEKMKKIAMTIVKENHAATQKMDGQAIYQVYESDPFFNLAFIAEMTFGLFDPSEQQQMISTAIKAAEYVIQKDMSKNHVFTESANNHTHKLISLSESISGKGSQESPPGETKQSSQA